MLFDEAIVYVYPVLDCNPVIINGLEDPETVYEPGVDVAVYDVTGPPEVGAVNASDADPLL
jgi:hypothetical protein